MKACVFAGSFDPPTNGHIEVINRSLEIFDKVIIAIGKSQFKNALFSTKERISFFNKIFACEKNIEICSFDGLLVDFMKERNLKFYVRGIRNEKDLDLETRTIEFNSSHYPEISTIYIPTINKNASVSSTVVRELLSEGKDVSEYLPKQICEEVISLYNSKK